MKVLLAVDGSTHSRTAEAVLSTFPFAAPVELTLVTVCPTPDLHFVTPTLPTAIHQLVDECRQQGQKLLAEVADRCAAWAATVQTLMLDGHPANELLRAIDQQHPDLVVIGARGLGTVSRFLLGSVSERVAKHAKCSVLVARAVEDRTEIRNILIGHDGSPLALAAIKRFAAFPLGETRSVDVYSITQELHTYGLHEYLEAQGTYQRERELADQRLEEARHLLSQATSRVTTHFKRSDDVGGTLLDIIREQQTDLVVVGGSGKAAWERFLLGSVSLRILHHAPCSVWLERSSTS